MNGKVYLVQDLFAVAAGNVQGVGMENGARTARRAESKKLPKLGRGFQGLRTIRSIERSVQLPSISKKQGNIISYVSNNCFVYNKRVKHPYLS